ncbi:MAG: hypothetical protein QOK37_2728 [Thermoanaerobaculia bacterium]|nr:hypothetical protein [Thermoanaerobaculia bacterium]
MAPLRGTNPTWLRRPSEEARISVPRGAVAALFSEEVNSMLLALDEERPSEQDRGSCEILAGSSTALPVDDESIQMVVASPPYCTRIDYAVTTSVELATLGLGSDEALRAVREQTIGTTTIRATQPPIKQAWGPTCLALLDAIKSHESRASETYYLKTHQQYFNDIHLSLKELHRCLAQDAEAVLVVQDSYYKNVHNDVPAIVAEMCNGFGWSLEKRLAFPVTRNLAGINGRAKKYLDGRAAVEVVLRFRKG